jgi:hypothetical protein
MGEGQMVLGGIGGGAPANEQASYRNGVNFALQQRSLQDGQRIRLSGQILLGRGHGEVGSGCS